MLQLHLFEFPAQEMEIHCAYVVSLLNAIKACRIYFVYDSVKFFLFFCSQTEDHGYMVLLAMGEMSTFLIELINAKVYIIFNLKSLIVNAMYLCNTGVQKGEKLGAG